MKQQRTFAQLTATCCILLLSRISSAAPTGYAPDAWVRGNNADTSYFGWDAFEIAGPPNFGPLYMLDDSTPDLGSGITATGTRIFQGANGAADPNPTTNGHVSSSQNYYSFFDTANDTIAGTAPASGAGGFTTVVLQLHSSAGGGLLEDLAFDIDDAANAWTLHNHLHGAGPGGLGFHWIEWSAAGANLPFRIAMTSAAPHRTIDSFEIDTFWSPAAPAVNAITQVPEPTAWLLTILTIAAVAAARWRRDR
jgi:hypothetical protein